MTGPNFLPWTSVVAASRGKPRRGMMRRAVFSDNQRIGLEKRFQLQKYISKPDRKKLAERLGLLDSQVKIWFQNRRMKWRNSKERELLSTGGSREQTLPTRNNPNPDLSDVGETAKRLAAATDLDGAEPQNKAQKSTKASTKFTASDDLTLRDDELDAGMSSGQDDEFEDDQDDCGFDARSDVDQNDEDICVVDEEENGEDNEGDLYAVDSKNQHLLEAGDETNCGQEKASESRFKSSFSVASMLSSRNVN